MIYIPYNRVDNILNPNDATEKDAKHSGVVVLYERRSDSLILTQRSEHLSSHPGEICFPGGLWDKADKNYWDTALRELDEELGIAEARVMLINKLQVERTLFGTIIHPWFARIESIEPYCLNKHEVSRLIFVPMELVQDARNYKDFIIERRGYRFKTYEFTVSDDRIWGATARIMKQLASLS